MRVVVCERCAAMARRFFSERLLINADPEAAADWINFGRGRKSMAPDDILEQSEFADATLNLHVRSGTTPHGRNEDRVAS